jgi:hypothetical protein
MTNEERAALSPCPFCGCENVYPVSPSLGHLSWRVFCDDCHAEGPQIATCNTDEGKARCQWVWQIRWPAHCDTNQIEAQAKRIAELERENEGLRANNLHLRSALAGIANAMADYTHTAIVHVEAISVGVKRRARAALGDKS